MKILNNRLSKYCFIKINNKKQIFILGDGRSGTTWLANVLNFDGKYLDFFEPFHGRRILKLSNDRLYPIENDLEIIGCNNFRLDKYARKTSHFAGYRKPRRIVLSGSILKDISSHFIFQKIQVKRQKNILIIRNPFSVALSKEGYGRWHSESDIQNLLARSPKLQALGDKCLSKHIVSTKFLEYIFIWCLLHRIILSSLDMIDVTIVFYETLLRDPVQSFETLFNYLEDLERFNGNKKTIRNVINKPSWTTTQDNCININMVNDQPWNKKKSDQEIFQAYTILKTFDLYDI